MDRTYCRIDWFALAGLVALVGLLSPDPAGLLAQEQVRVATYNIKWLDAEELPEQGERAEKLREIITRLEADVIGLQEIDDRAALEAVFPPSDWQLVIDDDSGERQDLALAVRRAFRVLGLPSDLDAEDRDFLFADTLNHFFPDRRDVLAVEVGLPESGRTFTVLVHHAKSRAGGRATTDPRRERAALEIVRRIEHAYHEQDVVLLGDFNDAPDDCSLNILERGTVDAPCGREDEEGPFLINLAEPLHAIGYVSFGRTSDDVYDDHLDTTDPGARSRNNEARGRDTHTGDQLFDQILITPSLRDEYVLGSTEVFEVGVAAIGNEENRASDHLPVSADLVFRPEADPSEPATTRTLSIRALLPDPAGPDRGHETVTLVNHADEPVELSGWQLRDRAGNEYALAGDVPASGEVTITMSEFTMPLNNSGDTVTLVHPDGTAEHSVGYEGSEVQTGDPIQVP